MAKKRARPGPEGPAVPEEAGLVEQLREAIRRCGESLNQLAARAGVDDGQLSRFMRGERGLTLDTAERLCRALGLQLAGDAAARPPAAAQDERPAGGAGRKPPGRKKPPAGKGKGRKGKGG